MAQKMKSNTQMMRNPQQWAQMEGILRDSAVDRAVEKAKTDLLYKHILEAER